MLFLAGFFAIPFCLILPFIKARIMRLPKFEKEEDPEISLKETSD